MIIALLALVWSAGLEAKRGAGPGKNLPRRVLGALAVVIVAFASLFAHFSLGYSLFVILAVIPPVALAVLVLPLHLSCSNAIGGRRSPLPPPWPLSFRRSALFLFACLVKTAPWEWDNIKLIIWAYLIVLPFLWSEIVSRWAFPIRAVVCVALFGSGFVTLFGGLAAGRTGFGLANRAELDAVGARPSSIAGRGALCCFPGL